MGLATAGIEVVIAESGDKFAHGGNGIRLAVCRLQHLGDASVELRKVEAAVLDDPVEVGIAPRHRVLQAGIVGQPRGAVESGGLGGVARLRGDGWGDHGQGKCSRDVCYPHNTPFGEVLASGQEG